MNRIFYANMMRLKKNKLFWSGVVLMAVRGIINCYTSYQMVRKYGTDRAQYPLDDCLFTCMPEIGIVLSVVISMYLGTDYSDGTIRNKIMTGRSRNSIYTANFLTCSLLGMITYCSALLAVVVAGMPLLGGIQTEPLIIAGLFADGLLMVLANAAVFNMIAMLVPNKAHSAVVSILLALVLFFLAVYLFRVLGEEKMVTDYVMSVGDTDWTERVTKNPHYISGLKRTVYEFLFDLLPSGQGVQIGCLEVAHPYRVAGCSAGLIAVFHVAGSTIFRKKNIV